MAGLLAEERTWHDSIRGVVPSSFHRSICNGGYENLTLSVH